MATEVDSCIFAEDVAQITPLISWLNSLGQLSPAHLKPLLAIFFFDKLHSYAPSPTGGDIKQLQRFTFQ